MNVKNSDLQIFIISKQATWAHRVALITDRLEITLRDHGCGALALLGCLFTPQLLLLILEGWPGWVNLGGSIKYQGGANTTQTRERSLTGPNRAIQTGVLVVTGSRAVVLECQYGPRRKKHMKKATKASFYTSSSLMSAFRHSCPARYAASCLCLYCVTVDGGDKELGTTLHGMRRADKTLKSVCVLSPLLFYWHFFSVFV